MAAYTAIDDPALYFQAKLYTGNGSSNAITFGAEEDMQPDFIWIKNRGDDQQHFVVDAVRGATVYLETDTDDADTDATGAFTSFDSDGFTLTGSGGRHNADTHTYVSWCWKESATAGFDMVLYTGTGSSHNENHSLSALPDMTILKRRDTDGNWTIFHRQGTGVGVGIRLDTDAGKTGSWNWDANSTTTTFQINGGAATPINETDATYIAYLFATKQGFSKFGTYTGNGNADGAFIYTGFRPAYVLSKITSDADYWIITDNKRSTFNPVLIHSEANQSAAELTTIAVDFLSNGFKWYHTDNQFNAAEDYLFMAVAEAPFVNSEGVPGNAR